MLMSDESAGGRHAAAVVARASCQLSTPAPGVQKKKNQKKRNPLLVGGKRTSTYGSRKGFKGVINFIFATA